jgi:hypothetical protein
MGDVFADIAIAALILTGVPLVVFLVWVAATSKTFVAVSGTLLMTALVAVVFIAAILGFARLIPWWAAIALAVLGSALCLLALLPATKYGLSRIEHRLKTEEPEHWADGESCARSEVEQLARFPQSLEDGNRLREELLQHAAEGHARGFAHEDDLPFCLAFNMGFTQTYWPSLEAAGFVAKRSSKSRPAQ